MAANRIITLGLATGTGRGGVGFILRRGLVSAVSIPNAFIISIRDNIAIKISVKDNV